MEVTGICMVCGKVAKPVFTCMFCGASVCRECYVPELKLCKICAAKFKGKNLKDELLGP